MLTKIGQVDGFLLVLLPDAFEKSIRKFSSRSVARCQLHGNRFAADNLNYARARLLDPRIESEFVKRSVFPPRVQRKLAELRMRIAAVSL